MQIGSLGAGIGFSVGFGVVARRERLAREDEAGIDEIAERILSVVREAVASQVPVFGINRGKLGFLATFAVTD